VQEFSIDGNQKAWTRHAWFTDGLMQFSIACLAFLLRLPFWSRPLDGDEGLYAYGGWRILKGLVLYRDLYDLKPPGVYFLNAFLFKLFTPDALYIHICASIFGSFTAIAVYLIARRVWGTKAGLLAGLIYALFYSSPYIQGCGVNTEVFMVLPFTWSLYFLVRVVDDGDGRACFAAGLLAGLATMFKQVAAILIFAGFAAVVLNRRKTNSSRGASVGKVVTFAIACALPWIASAAYFAHNGAFREFVFFEMVYPFRYMGFNRSHIGWEVFYRQISWVFKGSLFLWLCSALAVLPALRSKSMQPKFLILTLLLSCLGVVSGWNFSPHYFIQLVPITAIMSGGLTADVISRFRQKTADLRIWIVIALLVTAFGFCFASGLRFYPNYSAEATSEEYRFLGWNVKFAEARKVGLALRKITRPEDQVFVWYISPQINFYALRPTPAHFPIFALPDLPWNPWDTLAQDLTMGKPEYIVIFEPLRGYAAPNNPVIRTLFQQYEKIYSVDGLSLPEQGIYRRLGPSRP
jgi:4-amino-4-deoxy-L-arabinose transferase-like glycosyltransferase